MNPRNIALTAALLVGCQVRELEDTSQGGAVPTRVQEIFDARCNLPNCHSSGSLQVSLEAGDSAQIIGRTAEQSPLPLVDIGNVPGSYLAIKILSDEALAELGVERATGTTRMPQAAVFDAALQEELAIILGWIAGADLPGGDTGGEESSTSAGEEATSDDGSDSSTGAAIQFCGIEDLKAGAPNPIVSGPGAMEIPPDIGTILANNCGCHYADELDVMVADYLDIQPLEITTWAEWQAVYPNTEMPVLDVVRARMDDPSSPISMPPPPSCHVGGGEAMPEADRQTLLDWIDAGGPDGASWMP